MSALKYKPGHKFGRLKLLRRLPGPGHVKVEVECRCGKVKIVGLSHLVQGTTQSCGCLNKELATRRAYRHGMCRTPTYSVWANMIERCGNPKYKNYGYYGGRGIRVCRRWLVFSNFLADMGVRPAGKSIERIKNGRGYYPSNCRWATSIEQCRNRRSNVVWRFRGKAMCIAEWAEALGIQHDTLRMRRYQYGWSLKLTLTTPVRHGTSALA